jgi:profilin
VVASFEDLDKAQANGVRLAGVKFFTLQANPRSIYGKKMVRSSLHLLTHSHLDNSMTKADGCVLVKTKQAVLITEYLAPIQAGEATTVVEALADYLIGVGY